jgi:Putative prokaryotic signal transducing protein
VTTVAECSSVDEALMLRSLLEDSGVKAYVPDELTVTFRGQLGSVRLQVEDEDTETARGIIASART